MEFADLLTDKPPTVNAIMQRLREISFVIHPDIEEDCYGGKVVQMALYSIGRKNNPTHGISASDDHSKLYFHHFDQVDLSSFKLQGRGKHSRHIKIYTLESIDKKALLTALQKIAKIAAKHK